MSDERSTTDSPLDALAWRDAHGVLWHIVVSPVRVLFQSDQGAFGLDRHEWDQRVDYNEVGSQMVLRFDSPGRQIGFMVPRDQGQRLLIAMQWSNAQAQTSVERLRRAEAGLSFSAGPEMTKAPIISLFAAALACIPLVGFIFAALAVVCIVLTRRQIRHNARLVHGSAAMMTAVGILIVALAANVVAMVTWYQTNPHIYLNIDETEKFSYGTIVMAIVLVLLSLSVHEAGHAITAWWCGDEGPLRAGRVTLNPRAHIDPIGTVIVPIILAVAHQPVFGWARPVQVTLMGTRNPRRSNMLISLAGPMSNLLLALIFFALLMLLACCLRLMAPHATVSNFSVSFSGMQIVFSLSDVQISGFAGARFVGLLATCLRWGFVINLMLMLFNLLPIPPLDGSHVLASLYPQTVGAFYQKIRPFSFFILIILIYTNVLSYLLMPGMFLILYGLLLIFKVTGY